VKTLAEMTAEVVKNNEDKGWYENCATFPEAMALLHSEVSEALEAWRSWGLEDRTCAGHHVHTHGYGDKLCKPEGVGSEFADIFIRLLDDAWIFGQGGGGAPLDLELGAKQVAPISLAESFPANMNVLHDLISAASRNFDGWGFEVQGGCILLFLRQLCELYGIDLTAEYERKIAYNRTRQHRHGGKAI
jgi:hypothetical protein